MSENNSKLDLATNSEINQLELFSGQNEVGTRGHCQPMRLMTLHLSYPAEIDLPGVDAWLQSVLGIELSPCEFPTPKQPYAAAVAGMAWRCLLLIRSLLQAGNIPAFDVGSILRLNPKKENPSQWEVLVNVASIEQISDACYVIVTDGAAKTLRWVLGRNITPQNIERLYGIIEKQVLGPLKKMEIPGKSRIPILRVAHQMDIPFRHLGAGIYQLGWGNKARRMDRSTTEMDSALGSRLAQHKVLSANLLRMAGLPAPVHLVATTMEDAARAARQIGWPVVVKPTDLDRGEGVNIGIRNNEKLAAAFNKASTLSKDKLVIIERQVPGFCHRLFIAGGQLLYALRRLPKSVMGNGKQTVAELIQEANAPEQKLPPWLRTKPFPHDALAAEALATTGLTFDSVPANGQRAPLRYIESTEWGGSPEEVTEILHPANLDIALRAANIFSLDVAGIDIISPDITRPWYENGAIINEVNFSPLLGNNTISRGYIPHFLGRYIDGDGRIPIDVVVGGKAAMDSARKRQQEMVSGTTNCFLTSHELTLRPSSDEITLPFASLYRRCRTLLMNREVEAVVLMIQTDELTYTGMPIDRINQIITVDKELADWKNGNKKSTENRINQLMSLLAGIKVNNK